MSFATDAQTAPSPGVDRPGLDAWLIALGMVARHYGLPVSGQTLRQDSAWQVAEDSVAAQIRYLARGLGLRVKLDAAPRASASNWHLPVIVQLEGGRVAVVVSLGADGMAGVVYAGDQGLETPVPWASLACEAQLLVIARPARTVVDARVDDYIRHHEDNWFWHLILRDLRPYRHVMLASLLANALGLAGITFSMQVYDRVIPAQSFPTLYVLFSGVLLALAFDFVLRGLRMSIIDVLGKRADLQMSDLVFGRALRVRNRARPASTGSFIAQLRDLEHVREVLTSTTVAALVDLPFFLLFLAFFWYVAGALVLVPLGALVLVVAPGLLAQRRLRAHANEAMREASLRSAMLVEAVQGLEDIKTLQAEGRFQKQWNHYNAVTADAHIRLRRLTNRLGVWTHNVQTGVFAVVIFFGAPMVMAGDMTTGALVAASVLGSRMMAPVAQITQLLSRLQQARVAMGSLDQIMKMPVDNPEAENRIHRPAIAGGYVARSAVFRYGGDDAPAALSLRRLAIGPGERIAVLGRNGAGKSSLLQALSGLLEPAAGELLLDDVALRHIDPADVRRDVALLSQNARLFHGTIRENVTLGAPEATDEAIARALAIVGAEAFIRRLPRGLDQLIQEGGQGLSGGQRQAVLLARMLIREPAVMLLDEPTAAMDEATERQFIERFALWSAGRTVVIATHRMRVLDLVDRVIVLEQGAVALDGPREQVLKTLRGGNVAQVNG